MFILCCCVLQYSYSNRENFESLSVFWPDVLVIAKQTFAMVYSVLEREREREDLSSKFNRMIT